MPDHNPFEILSDTKPNTDLSTREKLFNDLLALAEPSSPQVKHTEELEEDPVVDAIFTHTEPEEAERFTAEPTSHDSVLTELNSDLQAHPEPVEPEAPVSASVLKSLDRAGLEPIVDAYTDLQQKLAAHQTLITAEREAIATLRQQMRQLNALGHDMSETRTGLDQGRQLVQADSCENLIRSIRQVNDLIQQDSQGAVQLMAPIKTSVEILELRVKHVSAIEHLLAHMQEGLKLQEQLAGADRLIHNLAKHLGLNFTQA